MIAYIYWDLNPEIIDGIVFFRWYGVFWVLGLLAGYRIMLHVYKSEGIPGVALDPLMTYVVLGVIVGARLGHILFYDPIYYWNNPIEILPVKINPAFEFTGFAGLASHGGTVGALLALLLYSRKFKKNYLWLLDRITIAGAALGAFIRLGNLMNSEIVGTPSNVPWAFIFTRVDQTPRHPAQLYEAIFYMAIGVILYFIWRSKRFVARHGFICGMGVTLIFAQRFLVEFVKANQASFEENLTLNMGQMLSIPLILFGVALMIWSMRPGPVDRELNQEC